MAKVAFNVEGIPVYEAFMSTSQSNFPAYEMDAEYITVHETENYDKGADAEMHARYLLNSAWGRQASWHFTVDDEKIYQHAKINQSGWHAGDGGGTGNRKSIGIEICENSDGDFRKAVANAQALIRHLMSNTGISSGRVVQHNKWSGKGCPNTLRPHWDEFMKGLTDKSYKGDDVVADIPSKPIKVGYSNNSIVDYLNANNIDPSFNNRKKLASDYNISNYRGTAEQNLELLNKMRKGGPSRNEDSKSTYKGDSIVDYLNSIKVNSSYNNRVKLARKYGISNYRGTASQNKKLLDIMRNGEVKKSSSSYEGKGDMKTSSIVDYLNSIKVDSSFSNRKKLAKKYGVPNYHGTARQNTALLKKLRGN